MPLLAMAIAEATPGLCGLTRTAAVAVLPRQRRGFPKELDGPMRPQPVCRALQRLHYARR